MGEEEGRGAGGRDRRGMEGDKGPFESPPPSLLLFISRSLAGFRSIARSGLLSLSLDSRSQALSASLTHNLSLSLCLCLSVSVSLCVSLSVSVSLSLFLSFSLSLSSSLSLSLFLSPSLFLQAPPRTPLPSILNLYCATLTHSPETGPGPPEATALEARSESPGAGARSLPGPDPARAAAGERPGRGSTHPAETTQSPVDHAMLACMVPCKPSLYGTMQAIDGL